MLERQVRLHTKTTSGQKPLGKNNKQNNNMITKYVNVSKTAIAATVASIGMIGAAMAQTAGGLDTTAATSAITDSVNKGTTVIIAGFAIGALFLVARVIRRGMRSAG